MIEPRYIRIVKNKGEDYFRLKYRIGDIVVLSPGFKNNKELGKIITKDNTFKIMEIK